MKHKVMCNNAHSMCGQIVDINNRTNKWEKTNCEQCLKFLTGKGKRRIKNIKNNNPCIKQTKS